MALFTIFLSVIFAVFSTIVMSYISMATPIGPWIAPTLVLAIILVLKVLMQIPFVVRIFPSLGGNMNRTIALAVVSGSIGGILATGLGFSFPTLYFLDPALFNSWMDKPYYFAALLTAFSLVAGGFGMMVANNLEHKLLVEQDLPFPIGQLIYKMIAVQQHIRKAYELLIGFVSTFVFCVLQDGFFAVSACIPKSLVITQPFQIGVWAIPCVSFDLWPMLWAIGFIAGHMIALPLAVGALSGHLLAGPIHRVWFSYLSSTEFLLAFCSGMVVSGTVSGFLSLPKSALDLFKRFRSGKTHGSISSLAQRLIANERLSIPLTIRTIAQYALILGATSAFLTYFNFSFVSQIYLLAFTAICTYQIAAIAGKIGLALLGRYATFVMVPAMFLFSIDFVQIVLIATFVEVCGGVATDILFGRKLGMLAGIQSKVMMRYQYLGILVSSLTVGVVFWLLINHFHLGSPELFAQKAQGRQLLIGAKQFDIYVLFLGIAFGWILSKIKINPTLVFGGLLMPMNISLGLIVGGFLTRFTKDRTEWEPFWSGVFASNSIWMLLKAII
jgi:hypothetical protein